VQTGIFVERAFGRFANRPYTEYAQLSRRLRKQEVIAICGNYLMLNCFMLLAMLRPAYGNAVIAGFIATGWVKRRFIHTPWHRAV